MESAPAKKLNLSTSNIESMEEEMEVTSNNHNSASGNSDIESDASQEEENLSLPNSVTSGELDKKLRSMENRITKTMTSTIKKLIERALKPLKDNIKSLSAYSKIQEKKMEDMGHIKSENQKLKTLIQEVKEENRDLKQRLNNIENKLLENNFIITGIPEDLWELESNLKDKVFDLIAYTVNTQDVQVQIQNARTAKLVKVKRLGTYSSRRGRPILIQFESPSAANYFWENKGYLPDGIRVCHQFTDETEQHRRILRPVFNAAKAHPNYRGKCKMEGGDLVIKGKKYGLHNLTELPDELSGHKVTSRTSNNVTCFFGELNPLPNFHRCSFNCDGYTFSSSEQFIQYTKCRYFDNNELAERILKTDDAFQCKSLA